MQGQYFSKDPLNFPNVNQTSACVPLNAIAIKDKIILIAVWMLFCVVFIQFCFLFIDYWCCHVTESLSCLQCLGFFFLLLCIVVFVLKSLFSWSCCHSLFFLFLINQSLRVHSCLASTPQSFTFATNSITQSCIVTKKNSHDQVIGLLYPKVFSSYNTAVLQHAPWPLDKRIRKWMHILGYIFPRFPIKPY